MRAGLLRHRVTIQKPVEAPDGQGGTTRSWGNVGASWASIRPLDSRETFFAGQNYPAVSHAVRMRASPAIKLTSRLLFGDRILNIVSLRDFDERGEALELLCQEKQA